MSALPKETTPTHTLPQPAAGNSVLQQVNRSWAQWAATITLLIVGVIIFDAYDATDARRWVVMALLVLLIVVQRVDAVERRGEQGAFAQLVTLFVLVAAAAWLGANPSGVIIIGFVLSAHAVFALQGAKGFAWIALFALALLVYMTLIFDELWPGVLTGLGSAAGFLFIGTAAHAQKRAEEAGAESRRLLAELQSAHARLQEYTNHAEALAISQERNRVARELHDTLGHRLTVAAVQLEAAQKLISRDPQKAERMVETVRGQVSEGLGEVRATVTMLRTHPQPEASLPSVIALLAAEFQAAMNTPTHVDLPANVGPLSAEQRHALVRATQEALTNVQRHARASNVWLRLRLLPGEGNPQVQLSVEDDGVGVAQTRAASALNGGGYGLRGLQERAEALHGQCLLLERPGGGTSLQLTLPLEEAP